MHGGSRRVWRCAEKPMILLHLAVTALYALGAWVLWPRPTAPRGGQPAAQPPGAALLSLLLPVAFALHAWTVAQDIATPEGLDLSLGNALSVVAGLVALLAWASGLVRTLPAVGTLVLPIAAVGVLAPLAMASPHRFPYATGPWAAAHVAVALLAYALFIVAALQALVLMSLEKRLHRRLPDPGAAALPPLLTLERFLFRLVTTGFVLLTLTVVSGALFSEHIFGRPFTPTHKSVFSVLAWLTFGALLWGRWRYGWRGRVALRWILAGTALLFLAYLGSKFVLEVVLGR
jgi:ABC-type uncharacterized transport system permease subunit